MGGRDPDLSARSRRERGLPAVYAVLGALAILIGLQFLLLMVGLEAFMGRRHALMIPAALGSALCFAAACGLVRYLPGPKA